MRGSSIHFCTWARISAISSVTMARSARTWPSRAMRSTSVSPDLSVSSVRVSETVRTAMFTGLKGLVSSILFMRTL
jgi:hypothetical protein